MFTLTQTPRKHHPNPIYNTQYTPQYSSPLSSSPLRSSPSPLKERCENLPTLMANSNYEGDGAEGKDAIMSSPTSLVKRAGSVNQYQNQQTSIFSPQFLTATPSSHHNHTAHIAALPTPPSSRGARETRGNFSKRAIKANPLMTGRERGEEGRETRRKLFLKKVREGGEEKAWERRGGEEEMLRCLWVGERGREVERRRAEGRRLDGEGAGEENLDEVMADEIAMMEKLELEALVESQMQENDDQLAICQGQEHNTVELWHLLQQQSRAPTPTNTMYGSDDEEYDNIFQNVIEEEIRLSQHNQQTTAGQDQDMMDLS